MYETIIICGIFLLGLIAVVWFMYPRKSEKFSLVLGPPIEDTPVAEPKYQAPPGTKTDFIINNYFPHHDLSVIVKTPEGKEIQLVRHIPPKSKSGLTAKQVDDYLKGGNTLAFYISYPKYTKFPNKTMEKEWREPGGNMRRIFFSKYYLDTPEDKRIRSLHVGMITSRIQGSPNQYSSAAANSVQGQGHVTIHNYSSLPLSLNEGKILVPPNEWTQYAGHMRTGVPLGTWFKDDNKLYETYQYLRPMTDIYYGVVSDGPQPIYGGWSYAQRGYPDEEDFGQSMYPLEEGIY